MSWPPQPPAGSAGAWYAKYGDSAAAVTSGGFFASAGFVAAASAAGAAALISEASKPAYVEPAPSR